MKNVTLTQAAHLALTRAYEDPEVSKAMQELGGNQFETVLHLISGSENEDAAFRRIKRYYLSEMSRRHAHQKDLGFRNFTEDELELLSKGPPGRALLTRMRAGDKAAVEQAKLFVKEIKGEREGLGLP